MFTQEEVQHHFFYDADSGKLYWKNPTSRRVHVGDEITYTNDDGYLMVGFRGSLHLVHRIIYLYVTGHWPDYPNELVDHLDLDKSNNRFSNFRLTNHNGNQHNRPMNANNTVGYKGVTRQGKKFKAQAMVNGVKHYLGMFPTPEEAAKAYAEFSELNHDK